MVVCDVAAAVAAEVAVGVMLLLLAVVVRWVGGGM